MEKIIIHKNDNAEEAIEKMIASHDVSVVFVVPRNSGLKDSISNFHLFKKAAQQAEKHLAIESVDDEVLALARAAKIDAIHPLFERNSNGRSLSDIVPFIRAAKEMIPKRNQKNAVVLAVSEEDAEVVSDGATLRPKHKRFAGKTFMLFLIAAVGVLVVAVLTVNAFFSRATITIRFQKTPLDYHGAVVVDAMASSLDEKKGVIPGQFFSQTKTVTQLFPASGRSQLSQKAEGKLTIYNAYSSAAQSLVATTRFVTPDGKIFRLKEGVVVPGAHITDGKIIPSNVEAVVVADVAGPAYNIGTVAKLVVPGFKGTPKYDGFYGTFAQGTAGGFSGEHAVPTDQDIATAKTKTNQVLAAAFREIFLKNIPKDFVVLEGASDAQTTKLSVNTATDQNGNFSVFGESQFRAIGFRDQDMRAFLMGTVLSDVTGKTFNTLTTIFTSPIVVFDKKNVRIAVDAKGEIISAFDPEVFRSHIVGFSGPEVRASFSQLSNSMDATLYFWPFWISRVPTDTSRIKVVVE